MNAVEIWNGVRWIIAVYLIGIGTYALVTRRMPRRSRPVSSWPFPPGREYRDRHAVVAGLVCVALGVVFLVLRIR